jgi:hypothetical protein
MLSLGSFLHTTELHQIGFHGNRCWDELAFVGHAKGHVTLRNHAAKGARPNRGTRRTSGKVDIESADAIILAAERNFYRRGSIGQKDVVLQTDAVSARGEMHREPAVSVLDGYRKPLVAVHLAQSHSGQWRWPGDPPEHWPLARTYMQPLSPSIDLNAPNDQRCSGHASTYFKGLVAWYCGATKNEAQRDKH